MTIIQAKPQARIFPTKLSPNLLVVQSGQTIQAVIDSITDAAADNPYEVMVPPGKWQETSKIILSDDYIGFIGTGRRKTKIYTPSSGTEFLELQGTKGIQVKNIEIYTGWNQVINPILIKDANDFLIDNISIIYGKGDGAIVFDHSAGMVSKYGWISNFRIQSQGSGIANINEGRYVRVYILNGNIVTGSGSADYHGISGNFLGSIRNVRISSVGGHHIYLVGSERGLVIESCHFEQAGTATGIGQSIYLKDCESVIVRGVTVTGTSTHKQTNVVYLENCKNCVIEQCSTDVTDSSTNADFIAFYADANSTGNRFLNNNMMGTVTGNRKKYEISAGNEIIETAGEEITVGAATLQHWSFSELNSAGGAITGTLPDGTKIGQRKVIIMTNSAASSTITVTHHETSDPEIGTFDAVDEVWILEWTGTEWVTIKATCTFV